jgi:amino acid permease
LIKRSCSCFAEWVFWFNWLVIVADHLSHCPFDIS